MIQALTPGQLDAIVNVASVAAIMLGVPLIVCGAGELWRKWRTAGERVDRMADPGRCDWCDGFTTDRRKCRCTEKCTFVPLCGARKGPLQ